MSFIFYRNFSNKKLKTFSIILILAILSNQGKVLGATIDVGTAVIPNECGTLGSNNPLRLLDCSIFKISKGMCCMLTITLSQTIEEEGVKSIKESYQTACIIMEKYTASIIRAATNDYKSLGGDVLIECKQNYLSFIYLYIFSILIFI